MRDGVNKDEMMDGMASYAAPGFASEEEWKLQLEIVW